MDDSSHEEATVLQRKEVSAWQVHAALRLEGQEELERSSSALFWSALGCGISMGLSMLARGVLQHHLARRGLASADRGIRRGAV